MKKNKSIIILSYIFMIFVVWEVIAFILHKIMKPTLANFKFPYLHDILFEIFKKKDMLISELGVTFSNTFYGFLIGAILGIILALIISLSKIIEKSIVPYLILSQMIPVLGLAPIVFGIVKDEFLARIIIAAYITFLPVSIGVLAGIKNVEVEKLELMKIYDASKWNLYSKLLLPASLSRLFNSLKVAAPIALTSSILVELMGAQHGIGIVILTSLYYGASQALTFWSAVILSALMGIVSYLVLDIVDRKFVTKNGM